MVVHRIHIAVFGCAVLCLLLLMHRVSAQDADHPFTCLFDTMSQATEPLTSDAVAARTDWVKLAEDNTTHRFRGDAAFGNNRITVVQRRLGAGVDVYARDANDWRRRAVVLPMASDSNPAKTLNSMQIVENSPSGVRLDAQYQTAAGQVTMGYRLAPGDPGLETHKGSGLSRIRVDADIRYTVVPNPLGDDMVFSANFSKANQWLLPTEQLLLAMLGKGGSVMVAACASDRQDCRMLVAGTGEKRRVTAVDLQAMEGKPVWIAFLEGRGIWTSGAGQSEPGVLRWEPPFAARWRFVGVRGHGRTVCKSYSEDEPDRRGASPFLIYPIERSRETPLTIFCVTDIMKNTIGVGPCRYITEAEGLTTQTPHDVTDWVVKQFARKRETRSEEMIRDRFDRMVEHVKAAQERINRYRNTSLQLLAACDAERDNVGPTSEAATRVQTWARMLGQAIVTDESELKKSDYGRRPAEAAIGLIGKPDAASLLDVPARELHRIGDAQNASLANCRIALKWLKLQCSELRKQSPQATDFIRRIETHLAEPRKD